MLTYNPPPPMVMVGGHNLQRWGVEAISGRNLAAYAAPYGVPTMAMKSQQKWGKFGMHFAFP